MDINTLRSVMTVISFIVFLGIVAWAVSKNNKARFEQAAQLPLLED